MSKVIEGEPKVIERKFLDIKIGDAVTLTWVEDGRKLNCVCGELPEESFREALKGFKLLVAKICELPGTFMIDAIMRKVAIKHNAEGDAKEFTFVCYKTLGKEVSNSPLNITTPSIGIETVKNLEENFEELITNLYFEASAYLDSEKAQLEFGDE